MAAACVITEVTHTSVKKITFDWQSAADGSVSGTTTAYYDGKLLMLGTDPDAAGTQPSDNYDITVTDSDGFDVLAGAGANRDNVNVETVAQASLGASSSSLLTLNVTNAGDTKGGLVYLWIR